jgi:hypothetical protein
MKKHILPLVAIILLCLGCGENNNSNTQTNTGSVGTTTAPSEADSRPAHVVILCDVSMSVSEQGKPTTEAMACIRAMISNCQQLLRHYPPGSRLIYYLIASNAYPKAFLDFNTPVVYQTNKYDVQDTLESESKLLKHDLDSAAANSEHNSCILTSIAHGYDQLAAMSRDQSDTFTNEMIVFSDMLEQCPLNPTGNINMNLRSTQLLDPAQFSKFTTYKGDNTWRTLNAKLHIIMNTPYMTPQTAGQIRTTWKAVFRNMLGDASNQVSFDDNPEFKPAEDYQ